MLVEGKRHRAIAAARDRGQAVPSTLLDWMVVILGGWLAAGAYLDGWAHFHIPELETFFTPWHAVFYSGFAAVGGYIVGTVVLNRIRGYSWIQAVPAGYELAVLGVLIFAAGGVGDMIWHTIFGIEVGVEALLSPTHLTLALGAGLMQSGPFRSAWMRSDDPSRTATTASGTVAWPAVFSSALLLSLFMFMTQFVHPWASPLAGQSFSPANPDQTSVRSALGVAGILLQTGLLMGLVLLAVQRWRLPFGSLTAVFGLSAVLIGLMRDRYYIIPAVIVAGLAADVLLRVLKPSSERTLQLRLFAFAVPVILYALYFLALALSEGIWWSIHLWTGVIVLSGVVGWLLSFLLRPPETQQI